MGNRLAITEAVAALAPGRVLDGERKGDQVAANALPTAAGGSSVTPQPFGEAASAEEAKRGR